MTSRYVVRVLPPHRSSRDNRDCLLESEGGVGGIQHPLSVTIDTLYLKIDQVYFGDFISLPVNREQFGLIIKFTVLVRSARNNGSDQNLRIRVR